MRLDDAAIGSWQENGYHISDLVIEAPLIDAMRSAFEQVFHGHHRNDAPFIVSWKPGDPPDRIRQMAFAWRVDPVLRESALTPAIGRIAAALTGSSSVHLLMDWIIHKPGIGRQADPHTGVGFHQDQAYWQSTYPANLITARIPLDDETTGNGCMVVIPGSHRSELVPGLGNGFWTHGESGLTTGSGFERSGLAAPVSCELRKGQVMFHHCMLIHGSGQNRSDAPRRSQNIHMMPGDTFYREGYGSFFSDYADLHGVRLRDGQRLGGELFPRIYARETRAQIPRKLA